MIFGDGLYFLLEKKTFAVIRRNIRVKGDRLLFMKDGK